MVFTIMKIIDLLCMMRSQRKSSKNDTIKYYDGYKPHNIVVVINELNY